MKNHELEPLGAASEGNHPPSRSARQGVLILGALVGVVAVGVGSWLGYWEWRSRDSRARYRTAAAALDVAGRERWVETERAEGFSRSMSLSFPQVTAPAGITESSADHWIAVEAQPARPADFDLASRGAILAWTEASGLVLSMAHIDLPPGYRAERPEEVGWLLLTHPSRMEAAYRYAGREVAVERIDARLVTLDGQLLARGTAEALPPRSLDGERPDDVYELAVERVAEMLDGMMRALAATPTTERAIVEVPSCIRNQMPDELGLEGEADATCTLGATRNCRASCRAGNARSCAEAAYTMEHGDPVEARRLYRAGCLFGDLNACTNWAASVRRYFPTELALQDCSNTVFRATCDSGDHFGCGMLGHGLVDGNGSAEPDVDAARALLEESCERLGMFSCDALGTHRRVGSFGESEVARADDAFRRACETGYELACERVTAAVPASEEAPPSQAGP